MASGTGGLSKPRAVSWRGGTGTSRRAADYATQQGTPRGRQGRGREGNSRADTAVDESRHEMTDHVARRRFN